MLRFDHDANSARLKHVAERFSDLLGEPLLHLKSPRENIDYSRKLRQADNSSVRDVRDVRLAVERKHVMFAQRVELDVANHDHALVSLLEERVANHIRDVHLVAVSEPFKRRRNARRSFQQPFSHRVFADELELPSYDPLVLESGFAFVEFNGAGECTRGHTVTPSRANSLSSAPHSSSSSATSASRLSLSRPVAATARIFPS